MRANLQKNPTLIHKKSVLKLWFLCALGIMMLGMGATSVAQNTGQIEIVDQNTDHQKYLANLNLSEDNLAKLSKRISLQFDNALVKNVLHYIADEAGLTLAYTDSIWETNDKVSVRADEIMVLDALFKTIKQTNLSFKLSPFGQLIVLRNMPKRERDVTLEPAQLHVIAGVVTSSDDNSALPGVNILVKGSLTGTTTDAEGKYTIESPTPNDTLVFSFVGYNSTEIPINGRSRINVTLGVNSVLLSEVVVTGFRASLLRANEIKRYSDQVVDAISAEDIGKLPDPNVADALQRVTGVQLTRQDNEGREVSVRGLSSFFTKITVNGAGAIPGAAADDSDGLDIGLLGADLASALEVYKSPTAKQVEGGVGGIVNIRTARPLELEKDLLVTGRLKGNFEPLQGSVVPEGSVQLGKIFNNQFGVIVGFQGGVRKYRRDAYHDDRSGGYRTDFGDQNGDGVDDYNPEKTRTRFNDRENDVTTFNLSLQWRPVENLNLYFDGTLSDKKKFRQFGQTEVRWRDMDDALLRSVVDENGTVVEAEFSEVAVRSRNSVREDTEALDIYNFGLSYAFNNQFDVTGLFSYSKNTVEEVTQGNAEVRPANIQLPAGQTFGYRLDGGDAGFSFINAGGFDFNDPALFNISDPDTRLVFDPGGNFDLYDHDQTAGQLDFTYDVGKFFNNVEFGGRWFSRNEDRYRPGHTFNGEIDDVMQVFSNLNSSPDDYGDLVDIDGFDPFLYPDAHEAFEVANAQGLVESTVGRTDRLFEDNYDTTVDSWAAYLQTNIRSKIAGRLFRGNVGVRLVGTDFKSTGVTVVNDRDFDADIFERAIETQGNNYTRALPSANFALDLTPKLVGRVALARVMRRPRPEDTRAAFNVNDIEFDENGNIIPSSEPYSAFNGNPELDPFIADQVDFSVEYYTQTGSSFSVGYFYKDVKDLTAFDELPQIASVEILNPITLETETVSAELTVPVNIDGKVKGVELSATQFFEFLPAPFDGLGVQGNFTYTDAKDENGDVIGGTSEQVFNAIAFYEKPGFGVRLAYNFRDTFNESPNRGIDGRWTDANRRLDLSAFYEINQNLMITLEGINITKEGNRSYLDGLRNRLNQYEQTGSRWLFGLRFKF